MITKETYDVVVMGADINGLIGAAVLAQKGQKVLIIDPREQIGGPIASLTLPDGLSVDGLLAETSSLAPKVKQFIDASGEGLEWHNARPDLVSFNSKGSTSVLSGNRQKALEEMKLWAPNDVDAYSEYSTFIAQIAPLIRSVFTTFPPNILQPDRTDLWHLVKKMIGLKRLPKATLTEFLKVAPMSVKDFLDERFESPILKSMLAMQGLRGTPTAPMSAYTTLNLLIWECLSGHPVKGGAGALIRTLQKVVANLGVEVRPALSIDRVIINNGRVEGIKLNDGEMIACRSILSTLDPENTFRRYCRPEDLPAKLDMDVQHYRCRGHEARIFISFQDLPAEVKKANWTNSVFLLTGSMVDIEQTFDFWKYGTFSENPVLSVRFTEIANGNAESGYRYLAAVSVPFVPYHEKTGWAKDSRSALLQHVKGKLSMSFKKLDIKDDACHVMVPSDIETAFDLTGGHLYGGELAIDQMFSRPFPSCARYATPIKGLFIGGDSGFSGGLLLGGSGFHAASAIGK